MVVGADGLLVFVVLFDPFVWTLDWLGMSVDPPVMPTLVFGALVVPVANADSVGL